MIILSKLLINYPIDGQEILDTTFFKVQEMALGNLMHKVHHLITDFLCNMFYLFIVLTHTHLEKYKNRKVSIQHDGFPHMKPPKWGNGMLSAPKSSDSPTWSSPSPQK